VSALLDPKLGVEKRMQNQKGAHKWSLILFWLVFADGAVFGL
jgi:hypothetical protein